MDPLTRAFSLTVLCAAASLSACKKEEPRSEPVAAQVPKPTTNNSAAAPAPKPLVSIVPIGDQAVAAQLVNGFHESVKGAWRWTSPTFSVKLAVPVSGAEKGATLRLKFVLPKALIAQHEKIQVSAAVGDSKTSKVFETEGEHVLDLGVPATALSGASITAEFAVDKPFVPGGDDPRSLGVVATLVELAPALASVVPVGTETYSRQLLRGFHEVGGGAWRWTDTSFSVRLAVPAAAAKHGALLRLNFALPETLISKNRKVTVTAKVGGSNTSKEFASEGEHVLELAVPVAALSGESIDAEYTVDKPFVPGGADNRSLGVIAQSVELAAR